MLLRTGVVCEQHSWIPRFQERPGHAIHVRSHPLHTSYIIFGKAPSLSSSSGSLFFWVSESECFSPVKRVLPNEPQMDATSLGVRTLVRTPLGSTPPSRRPTTPGGLRSATPVRRSTPLHSHLSARFLEELAQQHLVRRGAGGAWVGPDPHSSGGSDLEGATTKCRRLDTASIIGSNQS